MLNRQKPLPLYLSATLALIALWVSPGCSQTEPTPDVLERPPEGINRAYVGPSVDVEGLAAGFRAESREPFAARAAVVDIMGLDAGDVVADVGAGTGIYLGVFSEAVGPEGVVYAQEISEPLLNHMRNAAAAAGLDNVRFVLGETAATKLPREGLDAIFHSNVYHHFEDPAGINADLLGALKPGGEIFVLDFERIPGVSPRWILFHVRMDKQTVITEMVDAGFEFVEDLDVDGLQENYLLRFRKPVQGA